MGLFISDYLPKIKGTEGTPSTITIKLPKSNHSDGIIKGLIENDISLSFGNSFGPLIPDLTSLQDFFMLADIDAVPSWVGASASVWRGTNPIAFSTDMYLINWSPDLNYENQLKDLASYCTLTSSGNNGLTQKFMVEVHGGYKPNLLSDNQKFFSMSAVESAGDDQNADKKEQGNSVANQTVDVENKLASGEGTITVKIGSRTTLSSLLLTKCDIQPSIVEVYNPLSGGNPKPLFYRVGLSFQTARAALNTDLDGIFGG